MLRGGGPAVRVAASLASAGPHLAIPSGRGRPGPLPSPVRYRRRAERKRSVPGRKGLIPPDRGRHCGDPGSRIEKVGGGPPGARFLGDTMAQRAPPVAGNPRRQPGDALVVGADVAEPDGAGGVLLSRGRRVFGEDIRRASAAIAYRRDHGERAAVGERWVGIGSSRG